MLQNKMRIDSSRKEFCSLATQIAEIASEYGVNIASYRSEELSHFSKLTDQQQSEIISQLRAYLQICEKAVATAGEINFSTQLIWAALKELQLIPCSDLFSKITFDDVIEIHDLQNKQMFRNLKYFEFCSYTLEDIHCLPWTELYYRPPEDLQKLVRFAENIIKNPPRNTITCDFGPQLIQEINSDARLSMMNTVKYYCPLFDTSGKMVAGMAIESPTLINKTEKDFPQFFPAIDSPANNVISFEFKN